MLSKKPGRKALVQTESLVFDRLGEMLDFMGGKRSPEELRALLDLGHAQGSFDDAPDEIPVDFVATHIEEAVKALRDKSEVARFGNDLLDPVFLADAIVEMSAYHVFEKVLAKRPPDSWEETLKKMAGSLPKFRCHNINYSSFDFQEGICMVESIIGVVMSNGVSREEIANDPEGYGMIGVPDWATSIHAILEEPCKYGLHQPERLAEALENPQYCIASVLTEAVLEKLNH